MMYAVVFHYVLIAGFAAIQWWQEVL